MPNPSPRFANTPGLMFRALGLCLALPLLGCATAKPQLAARLPPSAPSPAYSGTILAIRAESSAQDPTGSLQQIMSILGQPAPAGTVLSEIVLRMPGNVIKTSVQPQTGGLAAGTNVAVTLTPATMIQPD